MYLIGSSLICVTSRLQVVQELSSSDLTANQASLLEDKRLALWKKLKTFRSLQTIYMPGGLRALEAENDERLRSGKEEVQPEHIKLWMPSQLTAAERTSGCVAKLPEMEAKLRVGQCHEALNLIRDRLHAKKHLINRRNKNITGQNKSTKARTIIGDITDRIQLLARKYTGARNALWALGGADDHGQVLQELKHEHLTMQAEEEQPDAEATRNMQRAGGDGGSRTARKKKKSKNKDGTVRESTSTTVLSWIWVAGDVEGEGDGTGLHGCEY